MNDQPIQCPKCGRRTDFMESDQMQEHRCLNPLCSHIFLVTEDNLFSMAYWEDESRMI